LPVTQYQLPICVHQYDKINRKMTTHHARGTFDVTTTPTSQDELAGAATLGRFTLDKHFHGGLDGLSHGEMLSAGRVEGSGGYVAVERFSGTLHGQAGSFALQHSGSMRPGVLELTITVVPDTGTDALDGLEGKLSIDFSGDGHAYDFEYSLLSDRA
jgi:hypothetical protein